VEGRSASLPGQSPLARSTPISAAREIWRAAEKLLKGYRLYGRGHQNVRGFVSEVVAKFQAHFERFGRLEAELVGKEVLISGEHLFHDESPDRNFLMPLAQAGVRHVVFEPGTTSHELERFFDALTTSSGPGEDDLPTKLWMGDLAHIKWSKVNEVDAADPNDEAAAVWIRAALQIVERCMSPGVERKPRRLPSLADIARDGIAELSKVPPPPWDKATLTPEMRASMVEALDSPGSAGERTVLYLAEALTRPRDEDLGLIGEMLVPALQGLVERHDYARATGLLHALDAWQLTPAQREALFGRGAEKVAASTLAGLSAPGSRGAILSLVRLMGGAAASAIVDAYIEAPADDLAEILRTHGDAVCAAIEQRLPSTEEDRAVSLVSLAGKIGGAVAVDVFDAAAKHPSERIAAEGRRRAPPPSTLSPARAAAQLISANPAARSAALDFLVRKGVRSAASAIETVTGSAEFRGYDGEEKRNLLEALGRLDRVRALSAGRRLLSEKSLLGGARQDETRAAAAWLLGELGDEPSRGLLEELANGRVREELKRAVSEALGRMSRRGLQEGKP
jgi:hypothetical protein